MVKVIHLIMLGDRLDFSNMERRCIESWKSVYPDWEIRIWRDKDCIDWIKESEFASAYYYNERVAGMAYVSDYIRCKILYECGGLYMDFDVFAVNRIPDSYFKKAFTAWDVLGLSINNGTCMYAPQPKMEIFREFMDAINEGGVDVSIQNTSQAANCRIEKALKKRGFAHESDELCETDIDLGDIVILNRSQFGGRHKEDDGYLTHGKEVYLVHACSGSWVGSSYYGYVEIFYTLIGKDTDMGVLKKRLKALLDSGNKKAVYILFLSYVFEFDEELRKIIENNDYSLRTFVLPSYDRGCAIDYIVHRIADIRMTKDFMRDV